MNAFLRDDEVVFALTYGSGTDWVKNVMAEGRAVLEYNGVDVELGAPRIVGRSEAVDALPGYIAAVTKAIGVSEFLIMDRCSKD